MLAGSRVYSVRDLTEKKSAEGRIHYLAHFDPLAGLPNRGSFLDRPAAEIREAEDRETRFALLSFDLDRFKETNDMFGHATGDAVLAEIAKRLAGSLAASEYAARFGGDEFFIIAAPADNPERIMEFAERILVTVRSPVVVDDNDLMVGASVGIAIFRCSPSPSTRSRSTAPSSTSSASGASPPRSSARCWRSRAQPRDPGAGARHRDQGAPRVPTQERLR